MPRELLGFYGSVECTHLPLEETARAAPRQQESQGFVGIQAGAKLNEQEAKGNALGDSGFGAGFGFGWEDAGREKRGILAITSMGAECPECVVSHQLSGW